MSLEELGHLHRANNPGVLESELVCVWVSHAVASNVMTIQCHFFFTFLDIAVATSAWKHDLFEEAQHLKNSSLTAGDGEKSGK